MGKEISIRAKGQTERKDVFHAQAQSAIDKTATARKERMMDEYCESNTVPPTGKEQEGLNRHTAGVMVFVFVGCSG